MGAENKHFKTLELFAYDNFSKYKSQKGDFIELKANQVKKLKMISIVDMAKRTKILHYDNLMRELDI
jgi:COP9 signalosome complex subunit 7